MSKAYAVSLRAPFTSGWRKSYCAPLAHTLEAAWRKHGKGWSVDSITQERKVVVSSEELAQAFARMDELVREGPKRAAREVAERVIQEMNKAGADEGARPAVMKKGSGK